MRLALEKAREGIEKGESPFGACIVHPVDLRGAKRRGNPPLENEIIACEHNAVISSLDSTAHAEVHTIRSACRELKTIDLSGCTIYSTCEPCPMCFSAIHWARISKVVFGARIEDSKHFGFNELPISNERLKKESGLMIEIEGNFMRNESISLFEYWSKKDDKIVY
jgi:tRNA(Arg) A34 adenosine deaminase TadA